MKQKSGANSRVTWTVERRIEQGVRLFCRNENAQLDDWSDERKYNKDVKVGIVVCDVDRGRDGREWTEMVLACDEESGNSISGNTNKS